MNRHQEWLEGVVTALTEAARAGVDIADLIARATSAAAANVGGIEALLAGRPGSWEAGDVRHLVAGTVGWDEQYLHEHRTEPLVVRVLVDDLLTDLGLATLYDQAHDELNRRYDAIGIPTVVGVPGTPEFKAALAALEPTTEQEAAAEAIEDVRAQLDAQQERDWAAYGNAFAENVRRAAAELFPGLPVPVEVIVELDWQDHPELNPFYGLEWQVWEAAHVRTPLPGTDIAPQDCTSSFLDLAYEQRIVGLDPVARLGAFDADGIFIPHPPARADTHGRDEDLDD